MNGQETVAFCKLVKAACPAQKFDEYTPDLWAQVLADIDYKDAERAVVEVAKRQPWIAPSDIIAEVRKPAGGSLPYHRPMREVLAEIEEASAPSRLELER